MPAGGRGVRAGEDKLWADVGGRPLLALTVDGLVRAACFDRIVVAAPPLRHADVRAVAAAAGIACDVVEGGERRRDSVAAALAGAGECELVCVHDGARPLCPPPVFTRVVAAARRHGAATAAMPCVDTIKRVEGDRVVETLPRESLVAVQTPQAFSTLLLRRAHASASDVDAADDCLLVERIGEPVVIVPGDPDARKITLPADLAWLRDRVASSEARG